MKKILQKDHIQPRKNSPLSLIRRWRAKKWKPKITGIVRNAGACRDTGVARWHRRWNRKSGAVPGYLSTPLPCQPRVYTRPPPAPPLWITLRPGLSLHATTCVSSVRRLRACTHEITRPTYARPWSIDRYTPPRETPPRCAIKRSRYPFPRSDFSFLRVRHKGPASGTGVFFRVREREGDWFFLEMTWNFYWGEWWNFSTRFDWTLRSREI